MRRASAAYRSVLSKEPVLPEPGSPLNGLLALRETSRLIQDLKSSISAMAEDLIANRERLNNEEANLRDAQMIMVELRKRVENLRIQREQDAGKKKSSRQFAKELVQKERSRAIELDQETAKFRDALKWFIDAHLASMVAAEDLGGPVVGDQPDISDTTLEAGYTAHGKERKPKGNEETTTDKSQQRIDAFLHRRADGDEDRISTSNNKREAAAIGLYALINKLLETAPSSYIELEKESAASRYLVKAKIAQFHPRDSGKIRLINFAREITD